MGGLLGQSSFSASSPSNLQTPVTSAQADATYKQAQDAIAQQAAFAQATAASNGLANQSNIYNQFGNVAAGQGPNPAVAQLAQATSANTANQAALMAGQRGAGANTGLIAREAAQQGAANQQQAVGQAATLQAQQSLNALGQQAGIAGQQVGQQQTAIANQNQFAQGEQGQILGAISNQNNAQVGMQSNINNNNQATATGNAAALGKITTGLAGAGGAALGLAGGGAATPPPASFSGGNLYSNFAHGGEIPGVPTTPVHKGAHSNVGRYHASIASGVAPAFSHGGKPAHKVPAMVSPGEKYLSPNEAKAVADKKVSPSKVGQTIPGKAKVKGDSLKNDTVPKTLEAGGVVIPRSVMESKDPAKAAAAFVSAHLSRKGRMS